MIDVNDVSLIGIEYDYPQNKYTTEELFDILGNKISEKVKENVRQLGVNNRYFINPIENILSNSEGTKAIQTNHGGYST